MSKSTHARLGDFPEPAARRARVCDRHHERPIRVAICDDHPLVVHGLSAFLGRQRAIHVVGTASDGDGAVALAVSQSPDVLLLDLIMPRVSGFEAARTILAMNAPVRLVALTGYEGPGHLERLLDAGMAGCLLKRADLSQLAIAIHVVAAGGVYVDPLLVSRVVTTTSDVDDLGRCVDRLTPREAGRRAPAGARVAEQGDRRRARVEHQDRRDASRARDAQARRPRAV